MKFENFHLPSMFSIINLLVYHLLVCLQGILKVRFSHFLITVKENLQPKEFFQKAFRKQSLLKTKHQIYLYIFDVLIIMVTYIMEFQQLLPLIQLRIFQGISQIQNLIFLKPFDYYYLYALKC